MSIVTDAVTKIETDLDTIKAGIAGLNTQIQDLNAKLGAGTVLTADDSAALTKLATDADALAGQFPAPAPVPAPVPPAPAA